MWYVSLCDFLSLYSAGCCSPIRDMVVYTAADKKIPLFLAREESDGFVACCKPRHGALINLHNTADGKSSGDVLYQIHKPFKFNCCACAGPCQPVFVFLHIELKQITCDLDVFLFACVCFWMSRKSPCYKLPPVGKKRSK